MSVALPRPASLATALPSVDGVALGVEQIVGELEGLAEGGCVGDERRAL